MKKENIIPHLGKKVRVTMTSGCQHFGLLYGLAGETVYLKSPNADHKLCIGNIESVAEVPDQGDPGEFPPAVRLFTGCFFGLGEYPTREQVSFSAQLANIVMRVDEYTSTADIERIVDELGDVFADSLHLDWICVAKGELPKPTSKTTIETWAAEVLAWGKRRGVSPAYLIYVITRSTNGLNGNGSKH